MSLTDPRRNLPAVEAVRLAPELVPYAASIRTEIIVQLIREHIENARAKLAPHDAPTAAEIAAHVATELRALLNPSPRRVINATGVILHTGLGRAPLSESARNAVLNAAQNCDLELDLDTGERGDRQTHVERLLTLLSGAESALVVNNNAAALYLTLNALAYRREVIVSRGQLIEIGGSFRLPQIMERAGVKLVEVGTTNRTRVKDYRDAITPKAAMLLRAYPSNYRIAGFTESVTMPELVALGREHSLPVVDDLGGGLLDDWTSHGLPYEPTVSESIQAGADLVLVSGDKILGGPQAGIILGRRDLVAKLKKSPLARVVRADKMTLAALNATLRHYVSPGGLQAGLPVWEMLTDTVDAMRTRAERLLAVLQPLTAWTQLEIVDSSAETGSGTLPATAIPSIAICARASKWNPSKFAARLRRARIPVVCKTQRDALWFDLRTLRPEDEPSFIDSLIEAVRTER